MIDKDLIRVFSVLSILNTYDKIFPKKYAYEDEIQKIKYKNFKNDNNNFKIIRQRNNSINSKYIPIKKGDINYVLLDTNKKYQFKFQLELEDNRLYSVSQARLDDFRDKIRFDFFHGIKQKREIY